MENLFSSEKIDRRVFVKGLGLVSMALLMSTFGGCESCQQAIKERPIRRRLRTGSPEVDADIATYAQAVTLMKGLPAGDPRHWDNQAAIHGTAGVGFNLCQHNNNHFFSWHRAYLFYFEKICQELTGNKKFGLPYWNWNQNPAINPAFLDPASSLFMARNNTTVAGHPSFSTPTLDGIFGDTNFFTFSSQIEGTPHNSGHTFVGGAFGGFGSARDPIFWTHHNMADYCWDKWIAELENNNTNDGAWSSTSWNHFVDGTGNPVEVTAGITTLMPVFSYQFESSAIGSSPAEAAMSAEEVQKLEKRIKKGADVRFDIKHRVLIAERAAVPLGRPFSPVAKVSERDFALLINSDRAKERIFVSIKYVQLPPITDFYLRVFINLPGADKNTPIEDPHYAGSFSFFGTHVENGPTHRHEAPQFLVYATETLQRLKQRGELPEGSPISIQLVAVPNGDKFERQDAELAVERLEFIITPVIAREGQ